MNIQTPTVSTIEQPPVIGVDELRQVLFLLARQHAMKARHYRRAAADLGSAIKIEITQAED